MELMEVYHEAMAAWIIARVTSGKCEGAAFVFGLIESAIRKEATEILLTPIQELDMVRMDFGRLHCYYRQPVLLSAARHYPGPVCVLGNLSCPHWQCCRGRSTHRKTIPWIGRRAL
jgi:hypothetical protein